MTRHGLVESLVVCLLASIPASGQASPAEPSPQDRALAQALFEEGKRLLDGGQTDLACAKLEESHRLEPAGGTLLNLASCHERQGRIATAWAEYQGAFELARVAGRGDRMAAAKTKVDELGPTLPRVRILVQQQDPQPEVILDETVLGAGTFGSTIPVDPGPHLIRARADGRRPFEVKLDAAVGGEPFDVVIPALEPEAIPPAPVLPLAPRSRSGEPPPEAGRGAWSLPLGITFAATSGAVLGVCIGFGVDAINKSEIAEARCPGQRCDREGLDAVESGRRSATVANITGAVAGALGVTSIVFFALSVETPSPVGARPAAVRLRTEPGHAGIELSATF